MTQYLEIENGPSYINNPDTIVLIVLGGIVDCLTPRMVSHAPSYHNDKVWYEDIWMENIQCYKVLEESALVSKRGVCHN